MSTEETHLIKVTGTVVYKALETGFWGIVGDDGFDYRPTDLPQKARKEGLRVTAELEVVAALSMMMWGMEAKIVRIDIIN